MLAVFLLLAVLFVAFTNGANDNFKGVATLFGSGAGAYHRVLAWGTITTFAGSLTALLISGQLVARFSGKGLVPDGLVGAPGFVGAVAIAAALTVFLATRLSFPVSTTHALTGALVGAGLVQGSGEVHLAVLGTSFFLPLLVSPVVAMALAIAFYGTAHWLRLRLGVRRESCVCVGQQWVPVVLATNEAAVAAPGGLQVSTCQERYPGTILSVTVQDVFNGAHYLSAGAVSFARGLNDTPKIVALLIAARAVNLQGAMLLVGLAMAAGAVLFGRRVAETLGKKITTMNHGQGLSANLVTAALVIAASQVALPVSTTHVSCGALFGIGAITRQARWKTIGTVVLAWVVTLPVAVLLAAAAGLLLR